MDMDMDTPPPLPPPPPYIPPSHRQSKPSPSSLYQIVLPKQARNQQVSVSTPTTLQHSTKLRAREQPILRRPKRTNPIVWCCAILCLVFSLLLILFGIMTLIVFVAIKPRYPVFDTPAASLSFIYFDSPQFMNGDIAFLANFSNPNRKLSVGYEYLFVELFFSESLVASRVLQPFNQQAGGVQVAPVHLLSSLVYLPPSVALELQKQAQRNQIVYNIRGTFKVKIKVGMIHYSYWLHAKCQMEMTSPPSGVLIRHSCITKR